LQIRVRSASRFRALNSETHEPVTDEAA